MALNYTFETRKALLEKYYSLLEQERDLDYEVTLQGADPDPEMESKVQEMRDRLEELREQYRIMTPVMPLSRCPHTGRLLYHSFDPYGLDGLWWNYEVSVRPADRAPSRFLSLTGSMKLGEIEKLPHIVKPGPDVPYVVPELLGQDGVKAVVSQIQIGGHTGYAITYFTEDKEKGFTLDTWGTNHRAYVDHKDTFHYDEFMDDDLISYDFNLEPWLSQEKLFWVAPGDLGFNLKTGAPGCPFLNLEGNRKNQIIVNGKVHLEENEMEIYEEED
ncbi:hypothetical protein KAI10_02810 [Candidatus Bathyarchaeota archaeon]|nr:hypothetical protein [Candidatus Bathyarchaeota archaeon]